MRKLPPENRFIEIYVQCDLEMYEQRDPKDLSKKASNKEIKDFTGITSAYEVAENSELILTNRKESDICKNIELIINIEKKEYY